MRKNYSLLSISFYLVLISGIYFCTIDSLYSQTNIIVEAGPVSYTNIKGVEVDNYPEDISDCTSVQFSIEYSFSQTWEGSTSPSNMEMSDECGFGTCLGDPSDPAGGTCDNCWDFMWMQFFIGSTEVDFELIGESGTTDAEQFGTYVSPPFCTDGETSAEIIVTNQNWASIETNTFENVTIICWEGIPSFTTNAPFCGGQDLDLNGDAVDPSVIDDWAWSNDGSGSIVDPTVQTTTAIGPEDGETYTLTVTDSNNCTASYEEVVSVTSGFTATLLGGGDVCEEGCTDSNSHLEIGLTGGTEPYTVNFSINGFNIPFPFAFDFNDNTFQICHTGSGFIPTWDENAIPIQITIPETFWDIDIEIDNIVDANGCTGTVNGGSISLSLVPNPDADEPPLDPICVDGATGYDLTQHEADILDGGSGDVIWLDDPNDLTSTISNPGSYDIVNNNPVWAVVFEDPCYSNVVELDFDINERPSITPIPIEPISICGEEIELPRFSDLFDIDNQNNPQYFLDAALTDGPYAPGELISVPLGFSALYLYDTNGFNCDDQASVAINAFIEPEILSPFGTLSACGFIELPEPDVLNEVNMSYNYNTQPDGSGTPYYEGDEIDESLGINILYLIVQNEESNATGQLIQCQDTAHISLIFLGGTSYTANVPTQVCDTLFLPAITPPSPTVGYFTNTNGIGLSYNSNDTISYAMANMGTNVLDTLYLFDPAQSGACATIDTIVFEIGRTPILDVRYQDQFCDQGILPPPSPNNPNLEYASDRDFTNILNPLFPISASTPIYFRDSTAYTMMPGACYAIDSFFLEIIDEPYAGQDSSIVICELTNQTLDIFSILGNPDTDGVFTTDSGLNLFDPTNVDIVNLKVGNYTIDYEIDKPGCPPQTSQITIEVVPPLNVGELTIDSICSSIGILDIPFLMGNPLPGGEWYFEDSNMNELSVPDPSMWDVTALPEDVYRISYTILGTDNNPYCANRTSFNSLTIIGDPSTGQDVTYKICEGYLELINLYTLLGNPDLGGTFAIDGNPVDFEITDPTMVDLSVLPVGMQEIYYSIEKPGCTPTLSTITIEVINPPALGIARNDTICSVPAIMIPTDYIQGNDPLEGTRVFDSAGNPVAAAPTNGWIIPNAGVYDVFYTVFTPTDYECNTAEGQFQITVLESLNAGDDNAITVCRGQSMNMNSLLSSDADLNGVFYQDGFPVADPSDWLPASLNDEVMVEYILESNSINCESDTAAITVNISDNLSAGNPIDDLFACMDQTILLSDFLDNETPGGQFYLSSDLITPVNENYPITENASFTYIIPGAPGCNPDSTEFFIEVVPDSEVTMSLSRNELCSGENVCVTLTLNSNVDGEVALGVSDAPPNSQFLPFNVPVQNGVFEMTLCTSLNFNEPANVVDTVFIGSGPILIDAIILMRTAFECQAKLLGFEERIFINEDFLLAIDTTLCPGESIRYGGQDYFTSESIMSTTQNGCDSIVNINIQNYTLSPRDLEQSLCEGNSYTDIPGFSFTENIDTTIILVGGSAFGCDSTINLKLSFEDKAVGRQELDLCFGDSQTIDGVLFDSTVSEQEVPYAPGSVFGCDSSTLVTAIVYDEVVPGSFANTICPAETYPLGDQVFDINNSSGIALLQGEAAGGCDSTVDVSISFYPDSYDYPLEICANESVMIGNDVYDGNSSSGTSSTNELSVNGCDSVLNVILTVLDLPEREYTLALCSDEDIEINGNIYNFGNPIGQEPISNMGGCDSLYLIEILDGTSDDTEINVSLCMDIDTIINGVTYNGSNLMGSSTLQNIYGCDSTVVVNIAMADASIDFDIDFCQGDSEGILTITDFEGMNLPVEFSIDGMTQTILELPYIAGNLEKETFYTISADDGNCSVEEIVSFDSGNPPSYTIDQVSLTDNSYQLAINTAQNFTTYSWTPASLFDCPDCANPIATIDQTETICVTVTSDDGCTYEAKSTLLFNEEPEVIDTIVRVYIPNSIALTDPNENSFMISSNIVDLNITEMMIFDRWGNLVHELQDFPANNSAFAWDGRRNGKDLEQGVYVYVVKYIDPQFGPVMEHGNLTLIR